MNFQATEVRFFHQAIVTAYIEYLSRFQDLTHDDIKICLSYFHKLFVVRKDYNGLFRLDFMQMLHKLKSHLPRGSSIRLKVEEFIYYFMKKFKVALGRFPNIIEVLFPRIEESACKCYLSTGDLYEKEDLLERRFERKLQQQGDGDKAYKGDGEEDGDGDGDGDELLLNLDDENFDLSLLKRPLILLASDTDFNMFLVFANWSLVDV